MELPQISSSVQQVSAPQLEALLADADAPPVLVEFGATWCQPCREFEPILERLASAGQSHLRVVKLSVDEARSLADRLKVRSIPTSILFRAGAEVARLHGIQRFDELIAWLSRYGLTFQRSTPLNVADSTPFGGAFYGDPSLKRMLVDRLVAFAKDGGVVDSRFVFWNRTVGSVSAALVRNASFEVFNRISGLPQALSPTIHFVCNLDVGSIGDVFEALPVGADLRAVPLRLLATWLADDAYAWAELLGKAADELRAEWLAIFAAGVGGSDEHTEAWQHLAKRAEALRSEEESLYAQDVFAALIASISPPPDSESGRGWERALLLNGLFFLDRQARYAKGWREPQFVMEPTRAKWFRRHYPSPKTMSADEIAQARRRYEMEHEEQERIFAPVEAHYLEHVVAYLHPFRERLKQQFFEILMKT